MRSINAAELRIVNEINDIRLGSNNKTLVIEGWGFISNAQHFDNYNTHDYTLHFKSKTHELDAKGISKPISHTDTMFYVGSPYCKEKEFNKNSIDCNHRYDNIGFSFIVPLNKLKMNETYTVSLSIYGISSRQTMTTEVYFPSKETITLQNGHDHYIIDSQLHDVGAKILYDHVLVRQGIGKTGKLLEVKSSCSTDPKPYYKYNTHFKTIFDKKLFNNTTYYQLKGNASGCEQNKTRIVEGNNYSPLWIASNFIEHTGKPLTIITKEINHAPIISVLDHPTLYADEDFDLWKGVSAYDKEDGDLTNKIKILENTYEPKPGSYTIKYSVTDSFNTTAYATKNVTVLRRNYPPVIEAHDITLKQYAPYNPYLYARAYDQDKKDISYLLRNLSDVDTSKLGNQNQCYSVTDSYRLSSEKCVTVTIVENSSNFRFIQKQRVFYKEDVPKIWEEKMEIMMDEIDNEIIYDEISLFK